MCAQKPQFIKLRRKSLPRIPSVREEYAMRRARRDNRARREKMIRGLKTFLLGEFEYTENTSNKGLCNKGQNTNCRKKFGRNTRQPHFIPNFDRNVPYLTSPKWKGLLFDSILKSFSSPLFGFFTVLYFVGTQLNNISEQELYSYF